jgi:hypothetical protein
VGRPSDSQSERPGSTPGRATHHHAAVAHQARAPRFQRGGAGFETPLPLRASDRAPRWGVRLTAGRGGGSANGRPPSFGLGCAGSSPAPPASLAAVAQRKRQPIQDRLSAGSNPARGTGAFARRVGPRPGMAGIAGSSPAEGSRAPRRRVFAVVAQRSVHRLAMAETGVRPPAAAQVQHGEQIETVSGRQPGRCELVQPAAHPALTRTMEVRILRSQLRPRSPTAEATV